MKTIEYTTVLVDLAGKMKKNGTIGGAEYVGACPECGGRDRFHVWPLEGKTGRFWCRQCERKGDGIDYLRWQHGMTYTEACRAIGAEVKPRRRRISVDHSSWKTRPSTADVVSSVPEVEAAKTIEYVSWYLETRAEQLGCLECDSFHKGFCKSHPRNQFVNVRGIDKCPLGNH